MKLFFNYRKTRATQSYGFTVGEHVFVDGREGEYIVVDVDHEQQSLQLLPLGGVGRIETVPAASVRIVMPPHSKDKTKGEADADRFGDPTAA